MNYLKKVGISFLYAFSALIISTFIISLFNYIGFIKGNFLTIIKIIIPIVSIFIGSYMIGKQSKNKGWLEGIKIGCIFIAFFILFNYLGLQNKIEVKNIIFYLILLVSSTFGGMFGINIDKENK